MTNIAPRDLLGVTEGPGSRFHGTCIAGAGGRVFGGQVLAQALAAAGATVDTVRYLPVSVHGHFLAPGDAREPVEYVVTDLKDGRSFALRRVDAWQGERLVTTATATFHAEESAPEHQASMPPVAPPDACAEFHPEEFGSASPAYGPVRARLAGFDAAARSLRVWLRFATALPDDPALRAGALVWLSDLALTRTVDLPRRHWRGFRQGASLDHTVWLHRPADPSQWLLVDHVSDAYAGARGIARGHFYDGAGTMRATAMQECLIRRPASDPNLTPGGSPGNWR